MGATFHNDRNFIRATIDRPRMRGAHTLEYRSHATTPADGLRARRGPLVIDNARASPK